MKGSRWTAVIVCIIPGMSSGFWSLYLMPNETAPGDWWMVQSAFSTSYAPGAEIEIDTCFNTHLNKLEARLKINLYIEHK